MTDDWVKGDFDNKARPSISAWLNTHPAVKWGAIAMLDVVALSATQLL
ncbi:MULTISPECIES: hypothetical protein [unclassified Leptolyngbya]|nr:MULTISPECIES: hypothetical protein [unclassified Leptolyngbya]MBD1909165.1 hypothetical protein [Leptolyngbya sp. FACHB-8]MBD2158454.1 hypothetical protein [Leptolyngbya sp. FACHB-16]